MTGKGRSRSLTARGARLRARAARDPLTLACRVLAYSPRCALTSTKSGVSAGRVGPSG